jgi:hypothetical protein
MKSLVVKVGQLQSSKSKLLKRVYSKKSRDTAQKTREAVLNDLEAESDKEDGDTGASPPEDI